ncbi:hypothetical protein Mapa_011202 [Marchantia paleacea]|nr:hypothetical protein Mapa_011202 [Marchantia paleacea]
MISGTNWHAVPSPVCRGRQGENALSCTKLANFMACVVDRCRILSPLSQTSPPCTNGRAGGQRGNAAHCIHESDHRCRRSLPSLLIFYFVSPVSTERSLPAMETMGYSSFRRPPGSRLFAWFQPESRVHGWRFPDAGERTEGKLESNQVSGSWKLELGPRYHRYACPEPGRHGSAPDRP